MLFSVFMLVIPADVLILLPKRKTMGVEVQVLHTEASFIRDTPPPRGSSSHTEMQALILFRLQVCSHVRRRMTMMKMKMMR